jgi:hypothetical protein
LKTQRASLVERYARSWPRDVITLLNDRRGLQDPGLTEAVAFLEMPGVYVLYQRDIPYYIGKATNLDRDSVVTRSWAAATPTTGVTYPYIRDSR